MSLETIQICEIYDIHFIFIPTNFIHLLQPIDDDLFSLIKTNWRAILFEWKETRGKHEPIMPKHWIPTLIRKLMKEIHEEFGNNLVSGFQKCGIFPLDKNEVLRRLPPDTAKTDSRLITMDNCFQLFVRSIQPPPPHDP